MKKCLAIIVVLALVAPAMAANVVVSDGGSTTNGEADIVLTADAGIVGVGLKVDGSSVSGMAVDSFFDVFIDSAFTIGAGYAIGQGTGIATQDAPGELAFPQSSFAISIGGLDDDGIGGGTEEAPLTATITLTGTPGETVTITEDMLRGGIVGYDGAMAITGLPLDVTFYEDATPPTCRDMFTGDALALYDLYVANGKDPSCWCNQYQCRGDANNDKNALQWRIYTTDSNRMVAAWKSAVTAANADPCADFAHDKNALGWTVYTTDLNILVLNWKKTDAQLTVCPKYIAP
jgi:hypothetical protein